MSKRIVFFLIVSIFLASCSSSSSPAADSGKLSVVATTNIVADVVRQVGGDLVDVQILLPEGTDPHSFDPTPQDIAKAADAELIFANGAGLEEFIDDLLESAEAGEKTVEVSDGVELLETDGHDDHEEGEDHDDHEEGEDHDDHEEGEDHDDHEEGEDHDEHEEGEDHDEHAEDEDHTHEDEHDHAGGDPHTWTDPNNVIIWVQNIEAALAAADPSNVEIYAENAAAYIAELKEVDTWIRTEIEKIPPENRKIVTDHRLLSYYVDEYGLEMAGAIIPGYSSLSEPSAQELAKIEDIINELDVQAIFVGKTVNPNLAERIAEDTGVSLVYFYTGSLSPAGGEAGSYLDYLRYNTNAFVNALK